MDGGTLFGNTTRKPECFKKTFRVTFLYILSRIRQQLERHTVTEDPIYPELRLAICLYRLGRGDYFYTIAEMTGLVVSTRGRKGGVKRTVHGH